MEQWYVIRTKVKKEESVVKQLMRVNYDVFLPKIKGFKSHKPLFPSYVFVKTDLESTVHHRLIRYTRGVSHILGSGDKPKPISSIIIETLKERTNNELLSEQTLFFKIGDLVTVKRGILKDLQGVVENNIGTNGRIKILFKWLSGDMRAFLKYTELERCY